MNGKSARVGGARQMPVRGVEVRGHRKNDDILSWMRRGMDGAGAGGGAVWESGRAGEEAETVADDVLLAHESADWSEEDEER